MLLVKSWNEKHIMIDIRNDIDDFIQARLLGGFWVGLEALVGTEYKLYCIIVVSVRCGFDVNNNITIVHPSTYVLPIHASRRRDTCTACSPQCVK